MTKILNDIIGEDDTCYRLLVIGFSEGRFPCSEDIQIDKDLIRVLNKRELEIDTITYHQLCSTLGFTITVV
jgi:hypothetical protein